MELLLTVIVLVVLVAVVIAVSRAGANRHQEDLSTHDTSSGVDPAGTSGGDARRSPPVRDRPAGPGAEAMGVSEAGAPSVDPDAERPR